jgi:hypothetical protein
MWPDPLYFFSVRGWLWLIGALLLTALLSTGLLLDACQATVVDKVVSPFECIEFWLNRYQTLVAGIAAFVGAWLTVRTVRNQIEQAERIEGERARRESDAARAVLPLALDTLCNYAHAAIKTLEAHGPRSGLPSPHVPSFPEEVIGPLQAGVRFLERDRADELADLIAAMQVFRARVGQQGIVPSSLQQSMVYAADLHARAARLFEFARSHDLAFRAPAADVRHSLKLAGVDLKRWTLAELLLDGRQGVDERKAASASKSKSGTTSKR